MTPLLDFPPDIRHSGNTLLRKQQLVMLRMLAVFDAICRKYDIAYWLDGGTLLGAVRHGGFIPWDDDVDVALPRQDYQRFIEVAGKEIPDDIYLEVSENETRHRKYVIQCRLRDRHSLIKRKNENDPDHDELGIFIDILPIDKFYSKGFQRLYDLTLKWVYKKLSVYPFSAKRIPPETVRDRVNNALVIILPYVPSRFLVETFDAYLKHIRIRANDRLTSGYVLGYGFNLYAAHFFPVEDIFPLGDISFEGHMFKIPARAHETLENLYGNYMELPPVPERVPAHSVLICLDTRLVRNQ